MTAPSERKVTLAELLAALAHDKLVDVDDLRKIRHEARTQVHPITAIAEMRPRSATPPHAVLSAAQLTEWYARWAKLPYAHIDPLKVDFTRIAEVMTGAYASRWGILPIEVTGQLVTIATAEPFISSWEGELAPLLRRPIRRVIANPADIDRYIVEFFNLAKSVRSAARTSTGNAGGQQSFEQLVELGRSDRNFDANDQHIVSIVDWLWQYAFEQGASDIHLEPRRDVSTVRFRIDGVLHTVYQVPTGVMAAMTSRIKLLGRMDVVEKRRPQDGRIKTRSADGREIELRLATLPTAFGEKLVMRIFDPDVLQRDLKDLGFPTELGATWQGLAKRPHGILLVTGPTGSGKTTTLYATLRLVATDAVNVCTIEDPIELVDPRFNQMQVQPGIDLNFAEGVRALMRQDPDIIMVGEIRDRETADMAIQAALTGHLVLSTMHTNDSVSAVTRLLDLGVPAYLISATVIGVLAQRLVRTLCPQCKREGEGADEAVWKQLVTPFRAQPPAKLWHAVGCLDCRNTGYKGRAGLYELLVLPDAFRSMVVQGKTELQALRRLAYEHGLRPIALAGAQKAQAGQTSLDEVLAVTAGSLS